MSMQPVYFALILFTISCSNSAPGGNLAAWKGMKWPQYGEETLIQQNGQKSITRIETTLESGNHLIRKSTNNETGNRFCKTLLTDFDDHLERNCVSSEGESKTLNTLDQKGRIQRAEYIDSNSSEVRYGVYEYPGQNEVFRAYRNGALDITVLGEKIGARMRYTTWVNNTNAPSIHVREYDAAGEGRELYISGGFRETIRTRVYTAESQKVTLTHEISQAYPEGMVFATVRKWASSAHNFVEENYRIAAKDFDFDATIDFETAIRALEVGLKYRSFKNSDHKPAA